MFEEVAVRLSLRSLVGFLTELCEFSRQQLAHYGRQMSLGGQQSAPPHTSLLLYRLGDVMARCIATDRPHLHLMRVWSVASAHFVEVRILTCLLLVHFCICLSSAAATRFSDSTFVHRPCNHSLLLFFVIYVHGPHFHQYDYSGNQMNSGRR